MTYTKNTKCWVFIADKLSRNTLTYNQDHEFNKLG